MAGLRGIAISLALAGSVVSPAAAAEAECAGFSPLEVACDTTILPEADRIEVVVTTDVTFVGLIEVTLSDADDSVTLPCPQASVVTSDCYGEADGTFDAGSEVLMRVEILSFEGLTPSIGNWSVTARG